MFFVDPAIQGMDERNTTIVVNAALIKEQLYCLSSLLPFCSFYQPPLSGAISEEGRNIKILYNKQASERLSFRDHRKNGQSMLQQTTN